MGDCLRPPSIISSRYCLPSLSGSRSHQKPSSTLIRPNISLPAQALISQNHSSKSGLSRSSLKLLRLRRRRPKGHIPPASPNNVLLRTHNSVHLSARHNLLLPRPLLPLSFQTDDNLNPLLRHRRHALPPAVRGSRVPRRSQLRRHRPPRARRDADRGL